MANEINELKKKRELKKKGLTKDDNIPGFFSSLLTNIINIIIITIVGSNFLFSIRSMSNEQYLPTNTNFKPYNVEDISSPFKAFPYSSVKYPQSNVEHLQNWFANTIKQNWSFSRSFVQEILKTLNEFNPIDTKQNDTKMNLASYYKYAIDSIYFLFSPIFSVFIMMAIGISGFFSAMYYGYSNPSSIIYKVLGLVGGYNIGIFTSIFQSIWILIFLLIKPLMVNFKHLFNTVKQMKHLLLFLLMVSLLSSAYNNLDNTINIGISIGLVLIMIPKIKSYL